MLCLSVHPSVHFKTEFLPVLCPFMPLYVPLCPFMPLLCPFYAPFMPLLCPLYPFMPLYAPMCPFMPLYTSLQAFTCFYTLYKLSSFQDLVAGLVFYYCSDKIVFWVSVSTVGQSVVTRASVIPDLQEPVPAAEREERRGRGSREL